MDLIGMPALEGVEHHVVDVRGAGLHVAELGSGPPVLLVHGFPQHWGSWRRLMPLLADRFCVLALDLRGFGWSDATPRGYRKDELAEDVAGVLDALGIERVQLVGHDWGGVVGFLVCLNHTDRVERYIPMNTGHVWPTLPVRRIPKQLGGFAYQAVLASPVVGRRVGASPRVLRGIFKLISTQTDAVLDGFDSYAPRFADPARARAVQQVYRTFQLYEYPAWVRGRYRDPAPDDAHAVAARQRRSGPHARALRRHRRARRRRAHRIPAGMRALPGGGATGARRRAHASVLRLLVAPGHQSGV